MRPGVISRARRVRFDRVGHLGQQRVARSVPLPDRPAGAGCGSVGCGAGLVCRIECRTNHLPACTSKLVAGSAWQPSLSEFQPRLVSSTHRCSSTHRRSPDCKVGHLGHHARGAAARRQFNCQEDVGIARPAVVHLRLGRGSRRFQRPGREDSPCHVGCSRTATAAAAAPTAHVNAIPRVRRAQQQDRGQRRGSVRCPTPTHPNTRAPGEMKNTHLDAHFVLRLLVNPNALHPARQRGKRPGSKMAEEVAGAFQQHCRVKDGSGGHKSLTVAWQSTA